MSKLDERISAALDAEADRAEVDSAMWPTVERRVGRIRRRRRATTAALASAACLAAVVAVARGPLGEEDGSGEIDVIDEPTTVETTVPDLGPDAIVNQPGPAPRRTTPPEQVVVVTEDGQLAVIDTATGEQVRVLADVPAHLDSILNVALSPDEQTVWFDTCCTAGGELYSVPIDGSSPPERWEDARAPAFASSDRWTAMLDGELGVVLADRTGDWGRYWDHGQWSGQYQELAWSFDGRRVVVRTGAETGQLLVLDAAVMGGIEASDAVLHDHQNPVVLPGGAWKLPTFRRDGRLVAAQTTDQAWTGRVLDLDSASVITDETFELDGEPLSLDHDQSGEWLLTLVREPGDAAGTLRWLGPDGQTDVIPGNYYSADW